MVIDCPDDVERQLLLTKLYGETAVAKLPAVTEFGMAVVRAS